LLRWPASTRAPTVVVFKPLHELAALRPGG